MLTEPALPSRTAVGEALRAIAHDVLGEARAALDAPAITDAVAVHDYRKAMKRWRAFLRLIEPALGEDGRALRVEARERARELAGARDIQAALDALSDIGETESGLSPASLKTMGARLDGMRRTAETTTLTPQTRERLRASLDGATHAVSSWPIADLGFADVAAWLAEGYRRARVAIPPAWSDAPSEELHELRQRVVEHRYQIEVVEPLWPRFGKLWIEEAQRLRDRLGCCQDLVMLSAMTAPHQPLAPWRSRLAPLIASRRAAQVAAARKLGGRLFAEKPKAFRQRLKALWDNRGEDD